MSSLLISLLFLSLSSSSSSSSPLYLTPLLRSGHYSQAQHLSHAHFIPGEPISSYSAFFTLDEQRGTHVHFWFHPVNNCTRWEVKPLILWLQGGLGLSTLRGGIQENLLAYNVTDDGQVGKFEFGLTRYMNVLMVDNSGVGFSHTHDPAYVVTSYEMIAEELYAALIQFFLLFPSLPRSIYLGATSAGVSKVTALGELILKRPPGSFHLGGIIMGDGLLDLPTDVTGMGEYFYNFGMLERGVTRNLSNIVDAIYASSKKQDRALTRSLQDELIGTINKYIGYKEKEIQDIMQAFRFRDHWLDYIELAHIRDQLHVGQLPYKLEDEVSGDFLQAELRGQNEKIQLEYILSHGVPFFKYQGQYDGLAEYHSTVSTLKGLTWPGLGCLQTRRFSRSQVWYHGYLFGYLRRCPGVWEVLALRASHVVQLYQPEPLWSLVNEFIKETGPKSP